MFRCRVVCAVLLAGLISNNPSYAEIYKTVDKDGRVTFSDTPPPNTNAKPVELKAINTTPPPTAIPYTPPTNQANSRQTPAAYTLKLLAPANGTTLLPNERSVTVSTDLNPNLQNGDQLAYRLDGNIVAKTAETSYSIVEPPRGEHSVSVDVINAEGISLAQSEAATIVVMRPIVKRPAAPMPKK